MWGCRRWYLHKFTLLPLDQIAALAAEFAANPGARSAQKALAREVTALVHGRSAADDAIRASEIMFGGGLEGIGEALFADVVAELPTKPVEKLKLEGSGLALTDALVLAGLSQSKGQARKDIEAGGVYLNNVRVTDIARGVTTNDLLFGKHVLLRRGKRTYAVLSAR